MDLDISAIKSVITIYSELAHKGINLVYLGAFNQEITKMFTSMAEDDMEKNQEILATKRKVYHVMVETLQNMNKHSDELTDKDVGKGMFMIGKDDECYYIITCNRISKEKRPKLQKALETVNAANPEELKEMYKKQIKGGTLSEKGGAGLGLIDIARKTKEKHLYHFLPFDEENDFFILKTEINARKIKEDTLNSKEVSEK